MTDDRRPEEVIREALLSIPRPLGQADDLAALDTLLQERDEAIAFGQKLQRNIDANFAKAADNLALEAERDQLREALRYIAGDHLEHRNNDECLADCQRVASRALDSITGRTGPSPRR